MVGVWASSFDWRVSRKEQCANFIGFRKKVWFCSTEWKLHRFYILYENFCCGTKYTETKINLKRLHRCWGRGQLWKNRKMKARRRTNLPIPSTEVVFINWKTTWSEWRNSNRANEDTGKFFVRTYMYLHELAALSSELQCCVLNKICLTLSRESGIFGAWQTAKVSPA